MTYDNYHGKSLVDDLLTSVDLSLQQTLKTVQKSLSIEEKNLRIAEKLVGLRGKRCRKNIQQREEKKKKISKNPH